MKKKTKVLLWITLSLTILAIFGILFVGYCNYAIRSCEQYCFQDISELPCCDTGLLLGASKKTRSGAPNLYFIGRVEAAALLFHSGKIKQILISGDNSRKNYDEPTDIKAELLKRGVPETAITLDYAGFRTLDSVVRAKNVFGKSAFVAITQKGHAERAVYIARKHGINAIGFYAEEPVRFPLLTARNRNREKLACVVAWLDVNLLNRSPKFPK
ncbi:MAG: YdcF family protein [Lentisphaeria bacterium]|nr:YdcF family protein [Lentisphaeria bacterium]